MTCLISVLQLLIIFQKNDTQAYNSFESLKMNS